MKNKTLAEKMMFARQGSANTSGLHECGLVRCDNKVHNGNLAYCAICRYNMKCPGRDPRTGTGHCNEKHFTEIPEEEYNQWERQPEPNDDIYLYVGPRHRMGRNKRPV